LIFDTCIRCSIGKEESKKGKKYDRKANSNEGKKKERKDGKKEERKKPRRRKGR
jgi:hypothetical protein